MLDEKFRLFQGVFGSSDEVLGALESGVDFERRIADIYQSCRSEAEISRAFDQLRLDLDEEIQARMADTRTKLLENFDDDVRHKLRVNRDESAAFLDRLGKYFWELTKHESVLNMPSLMIPRSGSACTAYRKVGRRLPLVTTSFFRLAETLMASGCTATVMILPSMPSQAPRRGSFFRHT